MTTAQKEDVLLTTWNE